MFRIILLFLFANNIPLTLGSAESDAEALNQAVLGLPNGYNESTLITVIYEKTHEERSAMVRTYKNIYCGGYRTNQLYTRLDDFPRELYHGLIDNPAYYAARLLIFAMEGYLGDEDVLIEIMVSRTSQEMIEIKKAYNLLHSSDLCDDIEAKIFGDLEGVLLALCKADRDESNIVDEKLALEDCKRLYEAGASLLLGTDEDVYNEIFFKRNYNQLRLMFRKFYEYQHEEAIYMDRKYIGKNYIERRSIETAIDEEYSLNTKTALLQYIKAVQNLKAFYASLIKESLDSLNNNESLVERVSNVRRLIRIIYGRAGVDLPKIVKAFGGKEELIKVIGKTNRIPRFAKEALISLLKANC